MLTEIDQTLFAIRVNGVIIASSLPSRTLAEAHLLTLSADQRAVAEIVPMTSQGKQVLFG